MLSHFFYKLLKSLIGEYELAYRLNTKPDKLLALESIVKIQGDNVTQRIKQQYEAEQSNWRLFLTTKRKK